MTKHALLSASGSTRWLGCPGSINAEKALKKGGSSEYADEGTLAHDIADKCLRKGIDAETYVGKLFKCKDLPKSSKYYKITIDKDMTDHVQSYLDYVRSFETTETSMKSEQRVDFSTWVPEGFGTLDATVLDPDARVCHIFDLKYGRGVEVSAFENTQEQLYALGILEDYDMLDLVDTFVLHIVQPRKYNYSQWEISVEDLRQFGKYANERASLALTRKAPRVPGNAQCQWCGVKADCKELDKFLTETITADFDDLTAPDTLPGLGNDRLRAILDHKKLIESFLKAVETKVLDDLLQGGEVTGYKLVLARVSRKFKEGIEARLARKIGARQAYVKKLIGITAAQKLTSKEYIDTLTFKPEPSIVLAPETDKRPAVVPDNVVDDFEAIK